QSVKPTESVSGSTENKATVDNEGNANVSLIDKNITDAIADAKAVAAKKNVNASDITAIIHVTTGGKDPDKVIVNLPKTTQEQVIDNKIASVQLVIDHPDLTIGINLAAIAEINRQAKADVQLSAVRIDNSKLSGNAKAAIGNRPAYDFNVVNGRGESVADFGNGRVSVEIPYTLQKGEAGGNICAVYVDANDKITYLTDSSYDAKRGTVVFSTSHFSTYGIACKGDASFTDINEHWAKDDILFAVNRGILTGTSSTTFSPNASMTRGRFVTALGHLANADISAYKKSSFSDVKTDACYMGYIEWGVKNNILDGIGGGKFDPDGLVTREQIAVMMDRYATAMRFKLSEVHTEHLCR
ncbi:S-layer homology domain-containing protein, partial [Lacrimispora sp.]|uniref:S-layer homology domain-containing protein n=1 Tax=Lacrimispora sp. TaxID=2719234 RepID=UPI0032E427D0